MPAVLGSYFFNDGLQPIDFSHVVSQQNLDNEIGDFDVERFKRLTGAYFGWQEKVEC